MIEVRRASGRCCDPCGTMLIGLAVKATARNTYDHRLRKAGCCRIAEDWRSWYESTSRFGSRNVNADVDSSFKETRITRILAPIDVSWLNSMIEAIWRKMKHDWLFHQPPR